jgi:hypothetical protein
MRVAPHPAEIARLVTRTFAEFGAGLVALRELQETIRIEQGQYVARSYRAASLFAMWLIDVGIVQFYDDEGQMLRTVNLFEERDGQRLAA